MFRRLYHNNRCNENFKYVNILTCMEENIKTMIRRKKQKNILKKRKKEKQKMQRKNDNYKNSNGNNNDKGDNGNAKY